jgi:hypothetical protein
MKLKKKLVSLLGIRRCEQVGVGDARGGAACAAAERNGIV